MTLPEEVSISSINKAMNLLDQLGLDVKSPSPAFEEALYIHRGVYINKKHDVASYKKIWENANLSDEAKVVQMKKWVKDEMKIDLDKAPYYDPAGVSKHADGSGHRYWNRWDMDPDKVAKEMKDYNVFHSTRSLSDSPEGAVEEFLSNVLDQGGEFTSSIGRIRKGVPIRGTGGASPSSDLATGGSSYFFTRIKKTSSKNHGFYFRIGSLSRQDAVSYSGDKFGRISALQSRGSKPSDWKRFANTNNGRNSNETNFKEGLSLDDLDFIRVRPSERDKVIKVFKERGIETLPDGRSVEDIVITTQQKPKASARRFK